MSVLLSPLVIKNLELKNRVIMPPMVMMSAPDSIPEDFHFNHYTSIADGGVGLIIIEATAITPDGRMSDRDLGLWDDKTCAALGNLVASIHEHGAKVGIQLNHSGRKCLIKELEIIAPSAIAVSEESPIPREMTVEEIKETVILFSKAAYYANKAGFDVIEIHAAHGYLLSQFLSPLSNKRIDEYCGSYENRSRFLKEVIEAISEVWPKEKPIFVRISAEDYEEGGNKPEDLAAMLKIIKECGNGIDVIDVSTGGVIGMAPNEFAGFQLPHADYIKKQTRLPVIGGGMITKAKEAEDAIKEGKADLIYVGNAHLKNPNWFSSEVNSFVQG